MKRLFIILLVIPASVFAQTGLSLETCKSLAVKNNYGLRSATNELTSSEELKKSVFTSYFPKVSAGFSAVRMSDYLVKSSIPQMDLPVYDGNPMNLLTATQFAFVPPIPLNLIDYMNIGYAMAAQPVFTGGRIYYGHKLARTACEINRDKKSATETEVLVKTEELYWKIVALNEKLAMIDSYRKLLENLNHDVSVSLNAGVVQKTDLLKVQMKQNELEVDRLKLTDGIEMSRKNLCQHIGIPYESSMTLADTVPLIRDPSPIFVNPGEAVKNRNEYKMLEKALEVEKLQKKITTGEYLPQLSVGVAGIYTDFMDKTDEMGIAFATLSIPISDWWGGSHKIRQSTVKVKTAADKLNETSELLALEILQAQNELRQNYFYIRIAEKSIEQAGENFRITKDNYDAGVLGLSDLLEAQSLLQSARNSLTEAKCNFQIARAKYLNAINAYE